MLEIVAAFVGAFVGAVVTHQFEIQRERRTALSGFHQRLDDLLLEMRRWEGTVKPGELKHFVNEVESAVYRFRHHLNEKEAAKLTEILGRISRWLQNTLRMSEWTGVVLIPNPSEQRSQLENNPFGDLIEMLNELRATRLESQLATLLNNRGDTYA